MKKTFWFVKLILNLLMTMKNPQNTEAALKIGDCLCKMGLLDHEIDLIKQDTRASAYLLQRRLLQPYDVSQLNELPDLSLGKTYAQHMISNNLKPDFYQKLKIKDDISYMMMRMRETHDLWHVITGFGTDVPGELGLQAFMFAQIRTPLSSILIGGRILVSTFKNPAEVIQIFDQVAKGWTIGRNATAIFGLDWDDHWRRPLSEIRSEFNVRAI